jgi:DNA-binding NarL/FixJ family response regulator
LIARPLLLTERIQISIAAPDPVARAGIVSQLRGLQEVTLVGDEAPGPDVVSIVVVDDVDEQTARAIGALRRRGAERLVLVAARIDDGGLLLAVEAGATGILRRAEVTPQSLLRAVRASAAGEGSVPPDLLGRLLGQLGRLNRQVLRPRGLRLAGLSEREIQVLKLLAEGNDTAEIGRTLFYSERTVKNIVHDITSRLELRNRTHAVAYAMRQGLI